VAAPASPTESGLALVSIYQVSLDLKELVEAFVSGQENTPEASVISLAQQAMVIRQTAGRLETTLDQIVPALDSLHG
jgi:hypothetical protein